MLTDVERDVLDFERGWWLHAGAKESAIRARLDWSAVRYYAVLNGLLDRADALEYAPMLIGNLRVYRERAIRSERPWS